MICVITNSGKFSMFMQCIQNLQKALQICICPVMSRELFVKSLRSTKALQRIVEYFLLTFKIHFSLQKFIKNKLNFLFNFLPISYFIFDINTYIKYIPIVYIKLKKKYKICQYLSCCVVFVIVNTNVSITM